jgi:glycosyltransferase involved in cell wall biosynthesis
LENNHDLLSIIIPVYNEAKTIETCFFNLREVLLSENIKNEILIIESNSKDNSREIVKRLRDSFGVKVFFQDKPLGKGNAVRLGMEKSSGKIIVIYDADLEYSPDDLPKLLTCIQGNQASFVLGTRHKKDSKMRDLEGRLLLSFIMNLGHVLFTILFNLLFRTKLTDPFTMYKIFRKNIFEGVHLKGNEFDLDLELVAKAKLVGAKIVEIPVKYKSRNYKQGKKVNFFTAPLTWILIMVHCRFQKNKWVCSNHG